eukprot:2390490-Amphidinium_carterae.1
MAKTIVELMEDAANDDLNKELEIDTGKAGACYSLAIQVLEEQEKAVSCGMQKAMDKHRSAEWSCELSIKQSLFFGLAAFFSTSLFFLPPSWVPSFSNRWYRPETKIGKTIYYHAISVRTTKRANWAYFFGISGFALLILLMWKRYVAKRHRSEATKQQRLAERFSESKRGIAQCK